MYFDRKTLTFLENDNVILIYSLKNNNNAVEKAVESVNNLVRKVRKMSETVFLNPSKNGENQTFLQNSVIKQNDYKNLLHVCNFLYVVISWKNGLLNGVNYDADF